MALKVNLFGIPEIQYNDQEIKFPFKKADALFYYILLVKRTTRDHLVNLFWADSEDTVAKKNLRNAIYIIKKKLGVEVFISPQRSMIELNPDIELELDVDAFNQVNAAIFNIYKGPLFEGLSIKGCENFENWVVTQRQHFESNFIKKALGVVHTCYTEGKFSDVEMYCKRLIKIDPFDEAVYRMLMESYYESGRYDKSLALYQDLVKLLDEELSITPDPETIALHKMIVQKRSQLRKNNKKESDQFFFGRQNELKQLVDNFDAYMKQNDYSHFLIQGELGVGKTALMNALITELDTEIEVVRVFCYQAIEGFNLKAWDDLIEKLGAIVDTRSIVIPEFIKRAIVSTFPSFEKHGSGVTVVSDEHVFKKRTVENAINELIKIITREVKLLLIFEDIQWLDEPSLIMLKKLVNERNCENPVVYTTCRNGHNESIERFIAEFSSRDIIKRIQLDRFSPDDTIAFASQYFGEIGEEVKAKLYEETEGNAFFVMELLNGMKSHNGQYELSPKIKDALKHRLLNLSKESLQVIQLASVYLKRFRVEDIVAITGKSDFEVLDLIEELEYMYLVKEELDDEMDAVYAFTHHKIKAFIYNDLSISKRKILHIRIANQIEKKLEVKGHRKYYSKLVYHYTSGNNPLMALKYRIRNLYEYLQSSHEVFPLIKERDVFNHESIFFSIEEIETEFGKISELLSTLKHDYQNDQLVDLELKFKHMTGRHYINNGLYEKGLMTIAEVIDLADQYDNDEYLVKGYLQNVFYAINTHNMEVMSSNLNLGIAIAVKKEMTYETGIFMRLEGLYHVLNADFIRGEALLLDSITVMKQFKDRHKYTLHIAAAYYYMGDSNRFKGAFETSIEYYEKAIEICENNDLLGRLTLFYTNAGHAAFNLGDDLRAQRYFESAIKLYEELDFPWRRSIAYGFLGLLHAKADKTEKALKLFDLADRFSSKMNNPYELAVVCRIKAELESMLLQGDIFSTQLRLFIEKSGEDFIANGIGYLKNFESCYEMRRLKELKIKRANL